MDSMRSLNRSLPSARPSRPAPPEQLLQAFRQAALSVTNLYKSAAGDHESIRQAGYQDAIDDLLKFLDKENLGLQDGEGWRIRQWATARYDASHCQHSDGEEEETAEPEGIYRNTSPEKNLEEEPLPATQEQDSSSTQPSSHDQGSSQTRSQSQPPPVFHFSAATENAMQTDDTQDPSSSSQEPSPPLRVEVVNRASRNLNKHNNRHIPRSTARSSSQTMGSKRKLPFPDMSEIFNVGFEKKDTFDGGNGGGSGVGGGGSKRSRLV